MTGNPSRIVDVRVVVLVALLCAVVAATGESCTILPHGNIDNITHRIYVYVRT